MNCLQKMSNVIVMTKRKHRNMAKVSNSHLYKLSELKHAGLPK